MANQPWNPAMAINAELQPGEAVRWSGRPTFFPMLLTHLMSIVFGIVFAAFGAGPVIPVAKALIAGESPEGIWPALFSSVFFVIGCLIIGKALADTVATRWTAYAVTNRRVLIVSNLIRKRVLSFGPSAINAVDVTESSGGSGTVVFRHEITKSSDGDSTLKMAFVGIEDVGNAAREIEQLRLSGQPAYSANGRDHR
ncbi:hypothetical protein CPY51_05685 [Rhizobium tubonense]|uniref:DUF304 domain-containing protein n=2 Tax=Rhizobium tubonense TaxID=484088 RepID=A0A2W4ER23_9HYPH|nr:hypothetical protein CPY51_05685 [Rhizobium tubonense]